jgi:hypothetical protein
MSLPSSILLTTCDIYRPFGAASPTTSGVACRLVSNLARGRGAQSGTNYLIWSHYLDLDSSVDIRDGCARAVGSDVIQYADGDEVRVPTGAASTRYVVVWVETLNRGSAQQFKRAYLLRHSPAWPGP